VNISELNIGSSVHVRELQLPAGVRVLNDPDLVVLHVVTKRDEDIKPAEGSSPEPEVLTKKKTEEPKE
jgi:large subunit ribosomal protein L25